jgi:hypothetical protein
LSSIRATENLVPLVLIARFAGFERDDPHAVMPQIASTETSTPAFFAALKARVRSTSLNVQPALPKGPFPP